MEPSIFTRIIKGEIPSHKIYEDEKAYAFLDIHPVSMGHTLVVPKRQVPFLWDLSEEDYRALMAACQKIAVHIRGTLGVPYVGVQVVGVDVPHAHVHLIPFSTAAEYKREPDMSADPDHAMLARIASRLVF